MQIVVSSFYSHGKFLAVAKPLSTVPKLGHELVGTSTRGPLTGTPLHAREGLGRKCVKIDRLGEGALG